MDLVSGRTGMVGRAALALLVAGMTLGAPGVAQEDDTAVARMEELKLLDAISIAIKKNTSLKISKIVADVGRENIEFQEGQFDTQITGSGTYSQAENPRTSPLVPDTIIGVDNRVDSYSAGVQKRFKSSPLVTMNVTSSASGDEFKNQNFNEAASLVAGLSVTFPLWRGRGEYLTTLPLEFSKLDFEARTYDLKHQVDINVLQTLGAYWNYRGAVEALVLLRESEAASRSSLSQIQKLIDAGELPKTEADLVNSQLSQRIVTRLSGERSVIQARAALADSLGVFLGSEIDANKPVTELPEPGLDESAVKRLYAPSLMTGVMSRRNDFFALDRRIALSKKQAELAEDDTKPTLNLVLGGEYTTFEMSDDVFDGFDADRYGPNLSVRLDYQWFLEQQSAKANQRIAQLGISQRQIELDELRRATNVNLNSALAVLIRADRGYAEARERVRLSLKTVANERQKLLLDAATVLDVLNVESNLLLAQLNEIQQRVDYASALASLMFVSGRLGGAADNTIMLDDLRNGQQLLDALYDSQSAR